MSAARDRRTRGRETRHCNFMSKIIRLRHHAQPQPKVRRNRRARRLAPGRCPTFNSPRPTVHEDKEPTKRPQAASWLPQRPLDHKRPLRLRQHQRSERMAIRATQTMPTNTNLEMLKNVRRERERLPRASPGRPGAFRPTLTADVSDGERCLDMLPCFAVPL